MSAGCLVGNSVEGFDRLFNKVSELEGVNNENIIEAMGSASNRSFDIRRRF